MIDMFTRQDAYQEAYNDYLHDCETKGVEPITFEQYAANGFRSLPPITTHDENDCF